MKHCLIVEDQEEFRQSMAALVEDVFSGVAVVHAGNLAEGRLALSQQPFCMALIDLGLPDGNGSELVLHVREKFPAIFVTAMTIFDDDDNLFAALRAGAMGYLLKSQPRNQLAAQLRSMKDGVLPMAPSIARRLLNHFGAVADEPAVAMPIKLTNREHDVLHLIVKGETVKSLALHLGIAPSTAAGYVRNIYDKLEVKSRAEAVARAMQSGIYRKN